MRNQVVEARAVTSSVLEEASFLVAQRRQVETKQQLLEAFTYHFILSEDEVACLTLTSEPVDDKFFAILAKAKRINKDCELLLGFESQSLGLEIMEQASKHLNMAFQKLYRWIQREFKHLNLENPQIGSPIRHALRILAERPTLFQNCLDFFAGAREHVLSESFFTALTGDSTSGSEDPSAKPIELVAHDPLRYVGDMLAWAHSAAVGEREALEVLFVADGDEIARGIQEGRDNEIWRLVADEADAPPDFDPATALNELVDRDMSGAARILRQRVEQVVQTNEDTILAYKLSNLLNFYRGTFSKLLGGESVLSRVLESLETEALRQFRSLMRDHIATLQTDFQHTPADLGLPVFLADALEQLTAIMKTYETSFTPAADREAAFQPVLAEAFEPFIDGCEQMGRSIENTSSSVFLINCMGSARDTLAPFNFTNNKTRELEARLEAEAQNLVETQYTFFRRESGLSELMNALQSLTEKAEDVRKVRSLEPVRVPRLMEASRALDNFLPSALIDAMGNLKHLRDSKLARDITEAAAEKFCVSFEQIEEMLILADELAEKEVDEELQSLRALFPRTSGEIRVLLS